MWAPPPPPDAQRAPAAILSTSRPPGVPVLPRARLHGRPRRRPRPLPASFGGCGGTRPCRPPVSARILRAPLPPNLDSLNSQRSAASLSGDWCRPSSCKTNPPEARNAGTGMARRLGTGRLAVGTFQNTSFYKAKLTTPRSTLAPKLLIRVRLKDAG